MQRDAAPRLIRIDTPERREYLIPEGTVRIGRSLASDICLEDTKVSRFHCYLVRSGDEVRVYEGESKNPARLDGVEVNGQRLRNGHSLQVGLCQFVYEGPLPPASTPVSRGAPRRRSALHRRTRSSPRRNTLVLASAAAAIIAAAAFVIFAVPSLLRQDDRPPAASLETARVEGSSAEQELVRLLSELSRAQQDSRREITDESGRRIQELTRLIAGLKADLELARSGGAATESPGPPATPASDAEKPIVVDPWTDPSRRNEGRRKSPAIGTTTVAVKRALAPPRTRAEIEAIVERLTGMIDEYAGHLVTPETLEPDLTALTSAAGRPAANAALRVHDHARGLLRQTDASITENTRRKEALLRQARLSNPASPGDAKEAADRKEKPAGYAYPRAVGPKVEADQRLLDSYGKAVEIHSGHREFLVALRGAVLASLSRLTDPGALTELCSRLAEDPDTDMCRAILPALEKGRSRGSIPVLYQKLGSARDPGLKTALRRTLTVLAGEDLGDKASDWAAWWAKNGGAK
ncbi:MAG TPA: FHA domain-containing protein [Planctomycetota bacterium]|nr:FHA domain-containing protein [Planctomycetota bacterium]